MSQFCVVAVTPPTGADLDAGGDVGRMLWGREQAMLVTLRPANNGRARASDLASDIMDLLGYTGAQLAVRKHQDTDLFRLLPFLHTSKITRLVIDQADNLNQATCENVLALAALAQIELWLIWRGPVPPRVAAIVKHHGPQISYGEACTWLANQPAPPAAPPCTPDALTQDECETHRTAISCLRAGSRHLLERDLAEPDQIRRRLVELSERHHSEADKWALIECCRDALRPAQSALAELSDQVATSPHLLRICDVAIDGSLICDRARRRRVPLMLRSILVRQRIAAMAAGQDISDPLLCYFFDKLPLPILTP